MEYYAQIKRRMGLSFVAPAQNGTVRMESEDGQTIVYIIDPLDMPPEAIQMAYNLVLQGKGIQGF